MEDIGGSSAGSKADLLGADGRNEGRVFCDGYCLRKRRTAMLLLAIAWLSNGGLEVIATAAAERNIMADPRRMTCQQSP